MTDQSKGHKPVCAACLQGRHWACPGKSKCGCAKCFPAVQTDQPAETPHRVQRSRAKGWRMPPNTVYVGRPTKWGNPFEIGRDGTSDYCVRLYRMLAGGLECITSGATHAEQARANRAMRRASKELRGKNLACFCRLDKPCHADVLLEIANAE